MTAFSSPPESDPVASAALVTAVESLNAAIESLDAGIAFRGAWTATTDYTAGQVVSYLEQLYSANADFTSGATFAPADWTPLSTQVAATVAVTPAGSLTQTDVQAALSSLAVRSDLVESDSVAGLPSKIPRSYFDLHARDYLSASELSGAADATAALNALSAAANALAVSRGQRVRVWGFQGASLILDGMRAREFVRWEMEDAEFRKTYGVNPMFYVSPTATPRAFSGMTLKGRTVAGSPTVHDVQVQRPSRRERRPARSARGRRGYLGGGDPRRGDDPLD